MSAPRVTVVIPTFNQRHYWLDAAVDSCERQTEPVETLVVDDGSDPPVKLGARLLGCRRDWVRVIRHEHNRGISAALNTGIAAMTGDWFCWLSSDDLLVPEKVEIQRKATEDAGRLCSFHRYYVFGNSGAPRISKDPVWPNHKRQRQELGQACLINGSTVMVHRSVFNRVGLFDDGLRYGQDWDMWCRIVQSFEWLYLPEVLGHRRAIGNLTERIALDPGMREIRDAEDRAIRIKYGP